MLRADVCIVGAGLAGLTLAHQLTDRKPELNVLLVEHRRFPVPEGAHKVGESTVEIAAHYLAEELGLRGHLEACHLPKFGLRLFFGGSRTPGDLAEFDEIGASRVLPVPTYQLDRGILENHLTERARARGITVLDGTTVRDVALNAGNHGVTVSCGAHRERITARYLVDASGRRAWLRSHLDTERATAHHNAAVWLRVGGDINVDDWSADTAWRTRCPEASRRFSTNHFMSKGYWVWIIPLASHATSVGVVYDPGVVDAGEVTNRDGLRRWLEREQPLVARALEGATVMDFHTMKQYAAGCRSLYSDDTWMLSGDAGVFADPFYSPGGDFIAMGNSFVTELITGGNERSARPADYQRFLLSFFTNTLSLYRGQYPGFGHRDLMVLKTAWDYAYYWAVLAKLYFSRRMLDVAFMGAAQQTLVKAASLNARMQKQFRSLGRLGTVQGGEGQFVDHHSVAWFHALKNDLLHGCPSLADTALRANVARLEVLHHSITRLLSTVASGGSLPPLHQLSGLE